MKIQSPLNSLDADKQRCHIGIPVQVALHQTRQMRLDSAQFMLKPNIDLIVIDQLALNLLQGFVDQFVGHVLSHNCLHTMRWFTRRELPAPCAAAAAWPVRRRIAAAVRDGAAAA